MAAGRGWNASAVRVWEHGSWFYLSHPEGSLRGKIDEHSKIPGKVVGAWGKSGNSDITLDISEAEGSLASVSEGAHSCSVMTQSKTWLSPLENDYSAHMYDEYINKKII